MQRALFVNFSMLVFLLSDAAIFNGQPTPADVISVYTTNHPGENDTQEGVYSLIARNVLEKVTQPIVDILFPKSDKEAEKNENRNSRISDHKHKSQRIVINATKGSHDKPYFSKYNKSENLQINNNTTFENGNSSNENATETILEVTKENIENIKIAKEDLVVNSNLNQNTTTNRNETRVNSFEKNTSLNDSELSKNIKFGTEFFDMTSNISNESLATDLDDFSDDDDFSVEMTTKSYGRGFGFVSNEFLISFFDMLTHALTFAVDTIGDIFKSISRGEKMES